jgi:hypothetical protein
VAAVLRPTLPLLALAAWLPLGPGQEDLFRGQEHHQQQHLAAVQELLLLLLLLLVQGQMVKGHQGLRAWVVQGVWGLAHRESPPLGFRDEDQQQQDSVSAPCRVPGVVVAVQVVRRLLLLQPPPLPLRCLREAAVAVRRLLATAAAAVRSLVQRQQWRLRRLLLLLAAAVRCCLWEWRQYMQQQRRQYSTCLQCCMDCRLARLVLLPVGPCMRC